MGLFNRKSADTATATATATGADLSHLTGDYVIDSTHSEIGFSLKYAKVTTMRGRFTEYTGRLHLDGTTPSASTAQVAIKVSSIDTALAGRDEHLRNGDFFGVEEFPEMIYRSSGTEQIDEDTYRMNGDLTIKGISRPVALELTLNGEVVDPSGNVRVGFDGTATINRSDFGLTYNAALEGGGVLISDKVKLNFDISAIKEA